MQALETKLKILEQRNNINYYDTFTDKNEWVRQLYYDKWQIDLLRDILSIKK